MPSSACLVKSYKRLNDTLGVLEFPNVAKHKGTWWVERFARKFIMISGGVRLQSPNLPSHGNLVGWTLPASHNMFNKESKGMPDNSQEPYFHKTPVKSKTRPITRPK
jgi:hypothetical protein